MARFLKKRDNTKGLVPGSAIFIGNKKVDEIRIRIIDYDKSKLHEDVLRKMFLMGLNLRKEKLLPG